MAKKRQGGDSSPRWDLGLRSVGENWGCPECAPISLDEVLPDLWTDQSCEGCCRPLRPGFDVWAFGSQLALLFAEIDSLAQAQGADGVHRDGDLEQVEASVKAPESDPRLPGAATSSAEDEAHVATVSSPDGALPSDAGDVEPVRPAWMDVPELAEKHAAWLQREKASQEAAEASRRSALERMRRLPEGTAPEDAFPQPRTSPVPVGRSPTPSRSA